LLGKRGEDGRKPEIITGQVEAIFLSYSTYDEEREYEIKIICGYSRYGDNGI